MSVVPATAGRADFLLAWRDSTVPPKPAQASIELVLLISLAVAGFGGVIYLQLRKS
jgi:hypothetical protein